MAAAAIPIDLGLSIAGILLLHPGAEARTDWGSLMFSYSKTLAPISTQSCREWYGENATFQPFSLVESDLM
jgi:hypothetical protein